MTNTHRLRLGPLAPLSISVAALFGGCDWTRPLPPEEQNRAAELVSTALDAWKDDQLAALAARTPPIRFVDDDLTDGWRLVEFDLDDSGPERRDGVVLVSINLTLRDREGNLTQRAAEYQVTLTPPVAVLRSDR